MWRIKRASSGPAAKTRWAALAAILLVTVAESLAQEKQANRIKLVGQSSERSESVAVRRIVVSIPDHKLALIVGNRVVKTYAVAVGAKVSPTPAGDFKIAQRIPQPTYYAPGKIVPPGEGNPLGTRWLGLGQRGYGIHGTNEPRSMGRNVSHGCIRMRNRDIEELFEMVRAGDVVELYAERTEELAQIFGFSGSDADATVPRAASTMAAVEVPAAGAVVAAAAGTQN